MHSMSRFIAFITGLLLAVVTFAPAGANGQTSTEPSVAQIYQAANSGDVARAQSMIDQVLQSHPNSARAHYVKAEISAKQRKFDVARDELAAAERLAPGLPFVKPEAVQALRRQVSQDAAAATTPATRQMGAGPDRGVRPPEQPAARGLPWGMIAVGVVVLLAALAFMRRRNASGPAGMGGGMYNGSMPPNQPNGPMGNAYPQQGGPGMQPGYGPQYGPQYGGQPGRGSSLARGLGTGLAVGAGAVAATELGRRMFGHHDNPAARPGDLGAGGIDPAAIDNGMLNADMGGDNFGMTDGGNWDDAGGGSFGDAGGSDDWNT
jgi:hypothetical protein